MDTGMFMASQPSVLSSILFTIVLTVILLVVLLGLGPIVDWFSNWMLNDPLNAGNPYASGVLTLFSWVYLFIILSAGMGYFIIWKTVIYSLIYGRSY
jgi:hypothetical protein